ncbi:hypothetical protein [Maliponia aquimaris]|uniref:DUF4157 domain-containing protein n=1 Tax=Maliponia aquimaris TaxID=1673631 RepID=A0A238KG05_9RHOB|nr:hypothetical protein [Maliponia aquimaris]SMX41002.1 hypothetical protein MAA8898_02328 [Maliponia aquimaris]
MRRIALLALFLLAACGRLLSPSEQAYLMALHGENLDTSKIRLVDGNPVGAVTYQIPVRPRTTCQERLWPPVTETRTITVSPAATTIFNRVLFREDVYRPDFLKGYPDRIDVFDAMLFAHEATHVWQWQNRKLTGYTPLKAAREHTVTRDPYLFDTEVARDFLDFGYEQQGSIVEEYVCCRLLDPQAPRTDRLRQMIGRYMPIDRIDAAIDRPVVILPWKDAQTAGICRVDAS